ncbi:MAG: hypothetical protein IMW89_22380 [Ktedonobacteraceae bacterium]|nr:hypothetical protein [Ktedonobacteraceae bacterium]
MTIHIEDVNGYFVQADEQRWHCPLTGQDIAYGILSYLRTHDGMARDGLPLSGEERIPGTRRAVEQFFERGCIVYDPDGEVDHVPCEQGPCFHAHIDDGRRLRRYLQLMGADSTAAPITSKEIAAALSSLDALEAAVSASILAIKHDLGQGQ